MLSVIAILSALAAAASWAVASIAIAKVLEAGRITPAAANLFKNGAAAFCFLLGALIFGGRWPVGEAWAWLFLSGFLGFSIADTLYFAAFRRCGVQTAATVMLLNVPIATLLAVPLAGDEIRTQVLPFIAVVLVGVILVIVDSRIDRGNVQASSSTGSIAARSAKRRDALIGASLAVVAAFAIGTAVPLGRGSFGEVSVCPGGFIRLLGGALGAVPLAALSGLRRGSTASTELGRLLEPIFAAPGPGSVWSRASLFGVSCAVLGLVPYHFAQRELPSGIASTLFASTPLFTLPLAVFLGQKVGWRSVLGTLVGFIGVAGILRVSQAKPVAPRRDLGPGPDVVLISAEATAAREQGRRPSFIRSFDPEPLPRAFVAMTSAPPVVVSQPAREGTLQPVVFASESSGGVPRARPLFPPLTALPFARGHWADAPFAVRLASRGLLVGTLQSLADEGLGYGIRLGLETDGPPALDLGWLHTDESDVLHGFADAAPLQNGSAQLVWIDDRDGEEAPGMTLLRREVRADGALSGEVVLDGSVCDCCAPRLVALESGAMVVAYRHRAPDNVRDIYFARRDPAGGDWTTPAPVHGDGWKLEGCPVSGPAAAGRGAILAVAWMTRATADGSPEIRIAFSRDDGRTLGIPVVLVQGGTLGRVALAPVGATTDDERFVVVHLAEGAEDGFTGTEASWRAALVDPSGGLSEFVLIADVPGTRGSGRLDLIHVAPGVLSAVWTGAKGLVSAEIRCGAPTLPAAPAAE